MHGVAPLSTCMATNPEDRCILWFMTLAIAPFADLDALRGAFVAQQALLTAERAELSRVHGELAAERAEKARVIEQNDRLRHIIRQLQRMQFGKRSERMDPDQL